MGTREEDRGRKRAKQDRDKERQKSREEDAKIVERVLAGDKEAFGELVKKYEKAIASIIFSYLGANDDVESAAQEVFLKAYRQLSSLSDPRQFGCWILKIARNLCIDILRKRRDDVQSLEYVRDKGIQIEHSDSLPLDKLLHSEKMQEFYKAFSKLPDLYRELILLKSFQNLSYEEISAITGLTKQKIGELLFKARKELRRLLQEQNKKHPPPDSP